jgi:hypothetical protein
MKKIIITSIFTTFFLYGYGQSGYRMKENEKYIDVNFLTSYYNQDGNNSAVEGGLGTEQLTDVANILIVNIPLDSARSISATVGADFYTSASTDMIDDRMSSASSKDLRAYVSLGYQIKKLDSGWTYGGRLGFSSEYDYTSFNGGLNLTKEWNEGNSEFSLSGQAFIDQWKLYLPQELRGRVNVPTTDRRSYNVSAIYSQVLNKRMQFSLSAEAIYMEGLLSTPFHRVFFADSDQHDIERLPASRLKLPFSVRFNYFPVDQFILRTYYRYYTDDFGIDAHTLSIELPFKVSDEFSIAPFFRYHSQSEADYFAPFSTHLSSEAFYTSDYDLSALSSQKYGLAFSYSPDFGLARGSLVGRPFMFKSIEFRTAYYTRDTGLDAILFSANFNFNF